MKLLVIDDLQDRLRIEPWCKEAQKHLNIDAADKETLEAGKSLFRGDAIFYLEEDLLGSESI